MIVSRTPIHRRRKCLSRDDHLRRVRTIAGVIFFLVTVAVSGLQASAEGKPVGVSPSSSALVMKKHAAALKSALRGRVDDAIVRLQLLLKEDVVTSEKDRIHLSLGRLYYQKGEYESALHQYQQVEAGGDSWLVALEERAWTHMKKEEPEKALAQLKTVLSPLFKDRVEPEPYFLGALAKLRVCDYSGMFKTIKEFKERFREKIKAWEALGSADKSATKNLKMASEFIQKMNVVEAEAIQRLYLLEDPKSSRGSSPKLVKKPGQLTFPFLEGDEVWLDEVDNYHVRIKGCPSEPKTPATSGASKASGDSKPGTASKSSSVIPEALLGKGVPSV